MLIIKTFPERNVCNRTFELLTDEGKITKILQKQFERWEIDFVNFNVNVIDITISNDLIAFICIVSDVMQKHRTFCFPVLYSMKERDGIVFPGSIVMRKITFNDFRVAELDRFKKNVVFHINGIQHHLENLFCVTDYAYA